MSKLWSSRFLPFLHPPFCARMSSKGQTISTACRKIALAAQRRASSSTRPNIASARFDPSNGTRTALYTLASSRPCGESRPKIPGKPVLYGAPNAGQGSTCHYPGTVKDVGRSASLTGTSIRLPSRSTSKFAVCPGSACCIKAAKSRTSATACPSTAVMTSPPIRTR
jgi:hypothetical protein